MIYSSSIFEICALQYGRALVYRKTKRKLTSIEAELSDLLVCIDIHIETLFRSIPLCLKPASSALWHKQRAQQQRLADKH